MKYYEVEILEQAGDAEIFIYDFKCQAEDENHAKEQAKDALEENEIIGNVVELEPGL